MRIRSYRLARPRQQRVAGEDPSPRPLPACLGGPGRWGPLRMGDWLAVASQLLGPATAAWLAARGQSCSCHCVNEVEPQLIGLIKGQLDRCGPEHLICPAAAPTGWHSSAVVLALLVTLLLGFGAGWYASRRHASTASGAAHGRPAAGGRQGADSVRQGGELVAREAPRGRGRLLTVGCGEPDAGRL